MAFLTRLFIFLPLFIFVFLQINDHESAELADSNINDTKLQETETKKVLVEVTDAMEEEEEEIKEAEEEVKEALVYKPSIAPATPQVLTSSSKSIPDFAGSNDDVRAEFTQISGNNESNSTADGVKNQSLDTNGITISLPSDASPVATTTLPASSSQSISHQEDLNSKIEEGNNSPVVLKIDDENLNKETIEKLNGQSEHNGIDKLTSLEGQSEKSDSGPAVANNSLDQDGHIDTLAENKNVTESMLKVDQSDNVNLQMQINKVDHHGTGFGGSENEADSNVTKEQLQIETGGSEINAPSPADAKVESLHYEERGEIKADQTQKDADQQLDTSITDTEKADEDNEKNDNEKKMVSFAEWKREKEEDTINQSKLHVPRNKTILKIKKKNMIKKNFASIDCGGKVIAANEEASRILDVLKEDKDIYMLNPCNVKAWFVVELCDRIQVDSIDLANFEMFSSTPEIFNVYVTSRYPSGIWEKVDTFHAKPAKQVQTFVFGEIFYAKYIKIEIKKYFGTEHYCPLSLLRVFGITEVEQFEESDEVEHSHEDGSHHDDSEHITDEKNSEEKTGNIFQAAKNVVAGLVNGVAIKLSGKPSIETNESSLTTAELSAVVTVTSVSDEGAVGGENSITWETWYYYRHPKQTCAFSDSTNFFKKIDATVSLVENSTHITSENQISPSIPREPVLFSIAVTPDTPLVTKTTSEGNISILKVMPAPSVVQKATPNVESAIKKFSVPTTLLDAIPTESSSVKLNVGPTTPTNSVQANDSSDSTSLKSTVEKSEHSEDTADILHFYIDETVNGSVIAEKILSNTSDLDNSDSSQNVTNENRTSIISDKEKAPAEDIASVDLSNATNTDHQLESSTTSGLTDTVKAQEQESIVASATSSTEVDKPKSPEPLPEAIKTNDIVTDVSSSTRININEKRTDNIPEYSVEKDAQTLNTKTTPGSKESIIAKLNSKLKVLEANLTMSMMYLDEMSERYQKAVEKIDERHKKKYSALNTSFNLQREMIKNQSYLISNLTTQVHQVVLQIQNLTSTTQEQHQKLIETHATWVFLEIIFILVFLLLCRSNPKSCNNNKDSEFFDRRRYSEPAMVRNKKVSVVERTLSDSVDCVGEDSGIQLQQSIVLTKKRKRKKSANKIITELEGNAKVQSISGVTEKTGPLFGCSWMNGIAGAFKMKSNSKEKISRQADALIDEVSDISCVNNQLRKAKSTEMPVIHEDSEEQSTAGRPRSWHDLEYFRKCC